ncbi:MAG TPA: universal stress protein [Dissulfurispiraceae bacterium]|nr:universal stress protein [Dissulfurispiraceae bacterium]
MGKYRKILVAVDDSEPSIHALEESFRLARCEQCWITAVSVVPTYEGDLDMTAFGNVAKALREPCEKALREATACAQRHKALVKTVCEQGEPFERIADLAEAENCDVIVMGRSGKGNFQQAVIGSVTARVIGYSQKDVLVVPPAATLGWNAILVATDGSRFSKVAEAKAIDFAKAYGARLHIIMAVDLPDELYGEAFDVVEKMIQEAKVYLERVRAAAEQKGVATEVAVREGHTSDTIIAYAQERNIETLVLGSHGRTGLRRLLMGSVAENVIRTSRWPVLVVKM